MKYVIIGSIFIYFIYVLYIKVKDMKKGKICGCDCIECPMKGNCKNA